MNSNRGTLPCIYARIVASLMILFMATVAFASTKSPITMKDLLHAESISDAQFAPDNSGAFAFVRGIPIAKQGSWGYEYANLVRSRVFVVTHTGAVPKEIPNTRDVHYTLIPRGKSWSPDGRKLLLVATTRKGYGLAIYDLATEKIMRLPGRINSFFPLFDWASDDRLVYYTIPVGVHQRLADNQVLANVDARWSAAWNGGAPQVTVSSTSSVFETSEPPPGSLMLADPRDGSVHKLATGNYHAIAVSPDSRYIAVVRAAERLSSAINLFNRRGELQVFSLNARDEASLLYRYPDIDTMTLAFSGGSLAWSPSGNRLLTVGAAAGKGRSDTNPYVVDVDSGQLGKLKAPAGLSFISPTANGLGLALQIGWVGDRPVAVAARKSGAKAPVPGNAPQARLHMDYGAIHHWRFDVYVFGAGRPVQNLTAFAKTSVNQFLAPSSENDMLVVADGALWKLVPGQEPVRLTQQGSPSILGFGVGDRHARYVMSPNSGYFHTPAQKRISLRVLIDGKPERAVLDIKSRKLSPLKVRGKIVSTAPNQLETLSKLDRGWSSTLLLNGIKAGEHTVLTVNAALSDKAVAKAESFKFTYEGKPLIGWVLLPPNAKPSVPLPAVLSVYGGAVYGTKPPPNAKAETGYPPVILMSGQLLAAQGYAVVFPSTPVGEGSTTNVMKTLADEAVAAVDALVSKGIIDRERVGVMGQSFGGYSTAAILAERSDYFRAGISMAGIYGWAAAYGTPSMADMLSNDGAIADVEIKMVEDGQIRLGKPFWKAPEAYMRNSPIFRVEDIHSPLLLLHGDLDMGATGLPGAMRMYNALLRAGKKNVALIHYWGQGHVADSAGAIRDQWSRITAWFDYYLKQTPHDAESAAAAIPATGN